MTPMKCKWFNGRGIVGIVMAENELGETFYFIGTGDGLHEAIDVNLITATGSSFPKDLGDALFGGGIPAVVERPASANRVPAMAKKGEPEKKATTRSPRKSGK